jgi:hypothetical protein
MNKKMFEILPIVDFTATLHPAGVGLLIINHLPRISPPEATPEQIASSMESRQYAIRAEQCTELARVLSEMADELHAMSCALN